MPGGDQTGPVGQGPRTGRGLGNCLSYGIPLVAGLAAAFGFGRRRGLGRGLGRNVVPNVATNPQPSQDFESKEEELAVLKEQAQSIENSLNEIKEKISKLEEK